MGGVRALASVHHPHQQLAALGVEQLGHAAHPEQMGLLAYYLAVTLMAILAGSRSRSLGRAGSGRSW